MKKRDENNTLKNFFRDGILAFCISSFTINIFKLMGLSGVEVIRYLYTKFMVCFVVSVAVSTGRVIADVLYILLKKNKDNEQFFGNAW